MLGNGNGLKLSAGPVRMVNRKPGVSWLTIEDVWAWYSSPHSYSQHSEGKDKQIFISYRPALDLQKVRNSLSDSSG